MTRLEDAQREFLRMVEVTDNISERRTCFKSAGRGELSCSIVKDGGWVLSWNQATRHDHVQGYTSIGSHDTMRGSLYYTDKKVNVKIENLLVSDTLGHSSLACSSGCKSRTLPLGFCFFFAFNVRDNTLNL
jgi:hypothetical protein